jgi:hypothetical protein
MKAREITGAVGLEKAQMALGHSNKKITMLYLD